MNPRKRTFPRVHSRSIPTRVHGLRQYAIDSIGPRSYHATDLPERAEWENPLTQIDNVALEKAANTVRWLTVDALAEKRVRVVSMICRRERRS